MTRDREHRALRTTVVASTFGYLAQALSLVAIPLFLGTLGASGYGLMVTVMAFMGYLCFADAGLSWGSMILIAQAHGRDGKTEIAHIIRHSAVLAIGSGGVVALALGVLSLAASAGWRLPMFAAYPEADRLILIAGVQLALTLQFSVFYNLFQGLQEGHWTGIYQGMSRVLGLGGGMIAAWLTHDVGTVMLVQLALTVLCGITAAGHARHRHPWAFAAGSWTDWAQYQAQLRIGAKNFLLQIGRTLSGTAPTLAISSILGPAMVPLYTVPTTLLTLFFTPLNSWNGSLQCAYGEAWTGGAREWVRSAFRKTIERTLLLGGAGVALFLVLGDPFVRFWTQQRLQIDAATALSVSAIVMLTALLAAAQFLLAALNRHRQAGLAEVANGLIAILLVGLAVRWIGLGGVGVGVVAAAFLTSGWVLHREVHRQLGTGSFPPTSFFLKIVFAIAAGIVAARLAGEANFGGDSHAVLLQLALGAALGLAGFFSVAAALKLVAFDHAVAFGRSLKLRFTSAR